MIGIYGGTFNPIHIGHLRAAEEIAERLELDAVLFVPSWAPPHKGAVAAAKDRLAWAQLAVADHPRFEVDAIEIARGGTSYTIDTLTTLGARLAPEKPTFIVGSDAFREMGTWREPARLFAAAHFAVMNRPPETLVSLAEALPEEVRGDIEIAPDGRSAKHKSAGTWIRSLAIEGLAVSSSAIRAALHRGDSVRYLVPEAARSGIEACTVYRDGD